MIILYKRPAGTYMKEWYWMHSRERLNEKRDGPAADRQRSRRDSPGSSEYCLRDGKKSADPVGQITRQGTPLPGRGYKNMA